MMNLNDDEAVGTCSREEIVFPQNKVEPSTTKFDQSKGEH